MSYTATLMSRKRLSTVVLPDEVTGKHWLTLPDAHGRERRIAAIEAHGDIWAISPSASFALLAPDGTPGSEPVRELALPQTGGLFSLVSAAERTGGAGALGAADIVGAACDGLVDSGTGAAGTAAEFSLFVEPVSDGTRSYRKYRLPREGEVTIGRAKTGVLVFDRRAVGARHAALQVRCDGVTLVALPGSGGVYLNGVALGAGRSLEMKVGDCVYLMGFRLILGAGFIAVNNPEGLLSVPSQEVVAPLEPELPGTDVGRVGSVAAAASFDRDADGDGTDSPNAFYRSPRVWRSVTSAELTVEEPPAMQKQEDPPAILRIGPSLGMALVSALMGFSMFSNVIDGSGSIAQAVPMLGMVVVMLAGALLWPTLQTRYNKRKADAAEARRQQVYVSYLDKRWAEIEHERLVQTEIHTENRVSVEECYVRVRQRDRRLFERKPGHSDFLELRVGTGDLPFAASVKWPQEKLALTDDLLLERAFEYARNPLELKGAPISLPLATYHNCGLLGNAREGIDARNGLWRFLRGLIMQICALHAPDEVKLVLLADPREEAAWGFMKGLPHCLDANGLLRFIATSQQEATYLSKQLDATLAKRIDEKGGSDESYDVHYVLIDASRGLAKSAGVFAKVQKLSGVYGFYTLALSDAIHALPKDINCILRLYPQDNPNGADYRDPASPMQTTSFIPDIAVRAQVANDFSEALGRIEYLSASEEGKGVLPNGIGFLEMFEVGRAEHLNISRRWAESDPINTLEAPLGVDAQGALSMLDAHEDAHGPHGLVAGTTGSGKSELIITWILSLAVSYRPQEVAFVLIDYKGGGLAGIFDSEKHRLPHLSGTITNLDGAAINRSLVSINSELKRRQDAFNRARDLAGLGSVDIYKYQELYRSGVVAEPIPHLFIISDEFAELKSQQPEFMDELISAARIGRSLGVHLVLATQKPSGVVNDQIWSNAKFKLCLKVADAADSREMIKRDDAAEFTNPGRYCLLVGYNEFFTVGQGAYAGGTYRPQEQFVKKVDDAVVLISNVARPLLQAKLQPKGRQGASGASGGPVGLSVAVASASEPESVAVLKHLHQIAADEKAVAPQLWLPPIPPVVSLADLCQKYAGRATAGDTMRLDPAIGELDDPKSQSQRLLTLPLSEGGNAVVYGSQGAGKSELLVTLLYDLLQRHSARTLNVYILDLGAESLGLFGSAPQVGDVVYAADAEKFETFFKLMEAEFNARRSLFSAIDGGYAAYAAADGRVVGIDEPKPNIVVVINNFEVFNELYDRHLDALTALTRDGTRYGITFVLTCSRGNGVSYRLAPNFKQFLALEMNSDDDYMSIFGSIRGVVRPSGKMRGLVRQDEIHEFQGAHLALDGSDLESVRALVSRLAAEQEAHPERFQAPALPVLPETVGLDSFGLTSVALERVPLGFDKESISAVFADFNACRVFLAVGPDTERRLAFLRGLTKVLCRVEGKHLTVYDVGGSLEAEDAVGDATVGAAFDAEIVSGRERTSASLAALLVDGQEALSRRVVVFTDLREAFDALEAETKAAWEQFFAAGRQSELGGVVVGGDPGRFSSFGYEQWYRELISTGNGIWVADGFDSQQALKVSRYLPDYRQPVPEGFGWVVTRGKAALVKHVE
ncbi:MAG: type VII secretion protein EssC [Coriobacteriales bacterium]|jgi:S-DNA-T family DNA segregation ATPase FtsK/SpoIIIE|nr:type VII secretion protein EssC [Coriobacteriales bacterium]